MRQTKTFDIEGRNGSIEVKELTVREILELVDPAKLEGLSLPEFIQHFQTVALPKATSLKTEQLLDMTPSEIDQVWTVFKEVNDTFFGLSSRLPLVKGLWDNVKPPLFAACGSFVVDWLRRVILEPVIMGSAISSTPSTSTSESISNDLPNPPTHVESERTPTKKDGKSSSVRAA